MARGYYGSYKKERLTPRYGTGGGRARRSNYRTRINRAYAKGNIRAGGQLRPELKWYDMNATTILTTTLANIMDVTGTTHTCNTIGQGNGSQQRIGDKAIVKGLQLRLKIRQNGFETIEEDLGDNIVRVIAFIDHQCNGTLTNPVQILELANNIQSYREMTTTARFTILMDKSIVINPAVCYNGTAGSHLVAPVKRTCTFYKKLQLLTQFDATGADDINSLTTNSINVFAFVDNANGPPITTVDLLARTRFLG